MNKILFRSSWIMLIAGGQIIKKLGLLINRDLSRFLLRLMIERLVSTNLLVLSFNLCLLIGSWIAPYTQHDSSV
jgi:hypothetical protein